METTTLTSKGHLVIPKPVRDALHLKSGTSLSVTTDGERIVLEPISAKRRHLSDWLPGLQVRRKVTAKDLFDPVTSYDDA
ncbi:MAG TPA: AbrB/MazE/SpoVT family DNA-binding domain-containing protein [Rhodanobacteraceae bacterium]|nr:AbrB/MazE/SpoVT family DNA-binding domain-containing protein [Rhodanobacteraceae bacterium]